MKGLDEILNVCVCTELKCYQYLLDHADVLHVISSLITQLKRLSDLRFSAVKAGACTRIF